MPEPQNADRPVEIEIRNIEMRTSKFTQAVLEAVRMYYAVPGVPTNPNGLNILLAFGALTGCLSELCRNIHRADPEGFRRVQPLLVNACAQLTVIASSQHPGFMEQVFLKAGLSHDGKDYDPKPPANPATPS